jgi:hypothetical protein
MSDYQNDPFAAVREIDAEMKQKEQEANGTNQEAEAQKQAEEAEKAKQLEAENAANEAARQTEAAKEVEKKEEKVSWEQIVAKNFEEENKREEEEKAQAKLNKAKENPFIASIIDTYLDGGDVSALLKEVNNVDPKTLDEKALFEMTLEKGTSQEDAEIAFERFSELPKSTRDMLTESKRSQLISNMEKVKAAMNQDNNSEVIKQEYKKSMDAIHSATKELNGKEINGVGISDRLAADIFSTATKLLKANRNNNNFDQAQSFKDAVTLVTAPYIKEAAEKAGIEKGKVQAINEFHNPSAKNDVKSTKANGDLTKEQKDIETTEAYTKQFI